MTKHELVLDFIWQFRKFGSDVADAFSNGMCFHFTTILRHRFGCGWCTFRLCAGNTKVCATALAFFISRK